MRHMIERKRRWIPQNRLRSTPGLFLLVLLIAISMNITTIVLYTDSHLESNVSMTISNKPEINEPALSDMNPSDDFTLRYISNETETETDGTASNVSMTISNKPEINETALSDMNPSDDFTLRYISNETETDGTALSDMKRPLESNVSMDIYNEPETNETDVSDMNPSEDFTPQYISNKTETDETALSDMNLPLESNFSMTISNEPGTNDTAVSNMNPSDNFIPQYTSNKTETEINETANFISGCLLIMDDNHKLPEWLAYHHHVLPLQHLVVAVDPNSVTSPIEIFNRWRKRGMIIEEWTDEDFMSRDMVENPRYNFKSSQRNGQSKVYRIHKTRQKQFIVKCLRHLKKQNRSWAMHIDSDEYLLFNGPNGKNNNNITTVAHRSVQEQGAVLKFLDELDIRNESQPCFQVSRTNFGSSETVNDTKAIPHILNDVSLNTMRYRKHGDVGKLPPKSLVNLSKLTMKDLEKNSDRVHPHKIVHLCKKYKKSKRNNLLIINHYVGSWESFSFRKNDARNEEYLKNVYKTKVDDAEDGLSDDNIRPWIDGFMDSHGEHESLALLKGAGVLPDME